MRALRCGLYPTQEPSGKDRIKVPLMRAPGQHVHACDLCSAAMALPCCGRAALSLLLVLLPLARAQCPTLPAATSPARSFSAVVKVQDQDVNSLGHVAVCPGAIIPLQVVTSVPTSYILQLSDGQLEGALVSCPTQLLVNSSIMDTRFLLPCNFKGSLQIAMMFATSQGAPKTQTLAAVAISNSSNCPCGPGVPNGVQSPSLPSTTDPTQSPTSSTTPTAPPTSPNSTTPANTTTPTTTTTNTTTTPTSPNNSTSTDVPDRPPTTPGTASTDPSLEPSSPPTPARNSTAGLAGSQASGIQGQQQLAGADVPVADDRLVASVQAHAALMLITFLVLAPIAMLINRHRYLWNDPEGSNTRWWSMAHIGLQVLATCTFIVAAAIAYSQFPLDNIPSKRSMHAAHIAFGVIITVLVGLQVIFGIFKPRRSSRQPGFLTQLSSCALILTAVLAFINMCTGTALFKELQSNQGGSQWQGAATAFGVLIGIMAIAAVCLEVYRHHTFPWTSRAATPLPSTTSQKEADSGHPPIHVVNMTAIAGSGPDSGSTTMSGCVPTPPTNHPPGLTPEHRNWNQGSAVINAGPTAVNTAAWSNTMPAVTAHEAQLTGDNVGFIPAVPVAAADAAATADGLAAAAVAGVNGGHTADGEPAAISAGVAAGTYVLDTLATGSSINTSGGEDSMLAARQSLAPLRLPNTPYLKAVAVSKRVPQASLSMREAAMPRSGSDGSRAAQSFLTRATAAAATATAPASIPTPIPTPSPAPAAVTIALAPAAEPAGETTAAAALAKVPFKQFSGRHVGHLTQQEVLPTQRLGSSGVIASSSVLSTTVAEKRTVPSDAGMEVQPVYSGLRGTITTRASVAETRATAPALEAADGRPKAAFSAALVANGGVSSTNPAGSVPAGTAAREGNTVLDARRSVSPVRAPHMPYLKALAVSKRAAQPSGGTHDAWVSRDGPAAHRAIHSLLSAATTAEASTLTPAPGTVPVSGPKLNPKIEPTPAPTLTPSPAPGPAPMPAATSATPAPGPAAKSPEHLSDEDFYWQADAEAQEQGGSGLTKTNPILSTTVRVTGLAPKGSGAETKGTAGTLGSRPAAGASNAEASTSAGIAMVTGAGSRGEGSARHSVGGLGRLFKLRLLGSSVSTGMDDTAMPQQLTSGPGDNSTTAESSQGSQPAGGTSSSAASASKRPGKAAHQRSN